VRCVAAHTFPTIGDPRVLPKLARFLARFLAHARHAPPVRRLCPQRSEPAARRRVL